MTQFLNRASVEIGETSGRTLSGIAMPWDKVAIVQDLVRGRPGPRYPEAFAPSSTDVSRAQHANFPVFVGHDAGTEPIGVVQFSRSAEALMFDAPLSKTPRADTFLELANDGAMRSVSIQFRPVKDARRTFPGVREPVLYRTEVGLRHLALAPTGYGQYEDAVVNAIRTELDETVSGAVQAADAAIDAAAKCLDPTDDDYNIGQAQALITAAQLAVDVALEMLGAVDADDAVDGGAASAGDPTLSLPARMELVWATVARRRDTERYTSPELDRAAFRPIPPGAVKSSKAELEQRAREAWRALPAGQDAKGNPTYAPGSVTWWQRKVDPTNQGGYATYLLAEDAFVAAYEKMHG